MGKVLPATRVRRIEFCESHLAALAEHADKVGTTPAAVAELQDRTVAARAAFNAAWEARNAARSATLAYHLAAAAMTDAAADIVKQVKAKAAVAGDGVYSLARIPVPARPSPAPPPGTPTSFAAALNPDGSLALRWTCANPRGTSGTVYQVWRQIGGAGEFQYLGATGVKTFADATLPARAAAAEGAVTYQVQAVRSTATGTVARFVVNLGVGGVTGGVADGPKLAA